MSLSPRPLPAFGLFLPNLADGEKKKKSYCKCFLGFLVGLSIFMYLLTKKIFLNTFLMPGAVLTEVRGIKTHRMVSFFEGFTISEEEMNTQPIQSYGALCYDMYPQGGRD